MEINWRFHVALVLAHKKGHRIASIRQLRWNDRIAVDVVSWRRENTKIGLEHDTPLTHPAVVALQLARSKDPAVGNTWILPSPGDAAKPCSHHLMRDWWERARQRAGIAARDPRTDEPLRLGWHSLRRKFATELKEMPLTELARLGGWADVNTLIKCYVGSDMESLRETLTRRRSYGAPRDGRRQSS